MPLQQSPRRTRPWWAACRANPRKSGGPLTPAGKARSCVYWRDFGGAHVAEFAMCASEGFSWFAHIAKSAMYAPPSVFIGAHLKGSGTKPECALESMVSHITLLSRIGSTRELGGPARDRRRQDRQPKHPAGALENLLRGPSVEGRLEKGSSTRGYVYPKLWSA